MSYHPLNFHDALDNYTRKAFLALRESLPAGTPLSTVSRRWHQWIAAEGAGGRTYESVERSTYPTGVLERLHTIREFAACQYVLSTDPVMAKHIDAFVGISPIDHDLGHL